MANTQQDAGNVYHHSAEFAVSGYPTATPPNLSWGLSAAHKAQLETESAISSEAIQARGYFTLPADANGKEWLKQQGFSKEQSDLGECLVIPIHNWRGDTVEYAVRPTIPRNDLKTGKPRKYEVRPKSTPVLDVSVLTLSKLSDPNTPVLITEGAKKADSAASRGFCAIS